MYEIPAERGPPEDTLAGEQLPEGGVPAKANCSILPVPASATIIAWSHPPIPVISSGTAAAGAGQRRRVELEHPERDRQPDHHPDDGGHVDAVARERHLRPVQTTTISARPCQSCIRPWPPRAPPRP